MEPIYKTTVHNGKETGGLVVMRLSIVDPDTGSESTLDAFRMPLNKDQRLLVSLITPSYDPRTLEGEK